MKCYECDREAELGLCKRCYGLLSGGPNRYRAEVQQLRTRLKAAEEALDLATWLLAERDERIRGLEDLYNTSEEVGSLTLVNLRKARDRLTMVREALRFYGDSKNWWLVDLEIQGHAWASHRDNPWDIARQALEGIEVTDDA